MDNFFLLLVLSTTFLAVASTDKNVNSTFGEGTISGADTNRMQRPPAGGDLKSVRVPPCPDELAITPCFCYTGTTDEYIVMDCSNVESEEQLQTIFQAEFPTREYQSFYMKGNNNLTRLEDVFQGTTFRIVTLMNVVIETITEDSFIASADTLQKLIIDGSMLNSSSFPFHTIGNYSQLTAFEIASSRLDSFPIMSSDSLTELWLNANEIVGLLPTEAFLNLPNIEEISVYDNFITEIGSGAFSSLPALHTLTMFGNLVSVVRADTFIVSANVNLGLSSNSITAVEPGAFTRTSENVQMSISLTNNFITEIVEYVWADVLQYNDTFLSLSSNPLACGCDVAWLLADPAALSRVDPLTTCQDDRLLNELDPADYAHC